MSLSDLAASQPEPGVSTPSETGMIDAENQGEQASETPVNSDGQDQSTETGESGASDRAEKRINALVKERNTAREEALQEKAAREAIERNMDHFQRDEGKDKTLADLDVSALKDFIVKARDNDELIEHIPEAQALLTEKQIQEGINKYKSEQQIMSTEKEGQDLTNLLLNNLAGERLRDTESDYFADIQVTLNELSSEQFNNVNKDQLLAVAMAEVNRLKSTQSAPTVLDKVVQNRNSNNTKIVSNNRAANAGSSDLKQFLSENTGGLTRSKQGQSGGSIKDAIGRLGLMQEFQQ